MGKENQNAKERKMRVFSMSNNSSEILAWAAPNSSVGPLLCTRFRNQKSENRKFKKWRLKNHFRAGTSLTLQSLLFSISLLFSFSDFPCFFLRFSFLFQGFQGFREERNPCVFAEKNPCFFQKSKGWRVRDLWHKSQKWKVPETLLLKEMRRSEFRDTATSGTNHRNVSIAARGAEQEGRNPAQGSRGFGAPTLTLQPLLFWKKQGFLTKKARVSLFAEPLKSLEKEGKSQEKAREIGKRKKQGNRKKQGLEGQGKRPRNSTPRFCNSGSRKPLPRGPLEPRKGSQGLGEGSSEASERCVRFQRSAKTRWATQRPLRGPIFPDAPEGVPTLGLLPSGHR